jgi:transcriptional regulator with XRE-family HTH domain
MRCMGEAFTEPARLTPSASDLAAREIRAEMARQEITQDTLAPQVGMPQATFSRRLAGRPPFTTTELERVAAALGVTFEQLLPTSARAA